MSNYLPLPMQLLGNCIRVGLVGLAALVNVLGVEVVGSATTLLMARRSPILRMG